MKLSVKKIVQKRILLLNEAYAVCIANVKNKRFKQKYIVNFVFYQNLKAFSTLYNVYIENNLLNVKWSI